MAQAQTQAHQNKQSSPNNAPPPAAADKESFAGAECPQGFERRSGDLAGYWESTTYNEKSLEVEQEGCPPVLFTPLHCTVQDNKIQSTNASVLIHCRLEDKALLRSAVKEEGFKVFPAGTLFGIWAKTGMQPLKKLAGCKVWMKNDGCKRIKAGQKPMSLFDIRDNGAEGAPLKVLEDRRKDSLSDAEKRRRFMAEQEGSAEVDEEFIPF